VSGFTATRCVFCVLLATAADFLRWRFITSGHFSIIGSTLPMRLMVKASLAYWRNQKAFPPHLLRKRKSGSDVKGSLLVVMTAKREQSKSGP
jgi:hypothetical protein